MLQPRFDLLFAFAFLSCAFFGWADQIDVARPSSMAVLAAVLPRDVRGAASTHAIAQLALPPGQRDAQGASGWPPSPRQAAAPTPEVQRLSCPAAPAHGGQPS